MTKLLPNALFNYLFFSVFLMFARRIEKKIKIICIAGCIILRYYIFFHYNRVTGECLTLPRRLKRVSQMMKLRTKALLNYLYFSVCLMFARRIKKKIKNNLHCMMYNFDIIFFFNYNHVTGECLTLPRRLKRVSQMTKLRPNALFNYLYFSVYLMFARRIEKKIKNNLHCMMYNLDIIFFFIIIV
jgi:HJR/Mrr/RecB family endonuclease